MERGVEYLSRHTSSNAVLTLNGLTLLLLVAAILLAPAGCLPPRTPDLSGWHVLYRRPGEVSRQRVDLRAGGDVMLARFVARTAEREGVERPFAGLGTLLDGDLALANLESALSDCQTNLRPGPYRLLAPTAFAPALRTAGFEVLSLANNHTLDAGPAGLLDSLDALRAAGVQPAGAAPSLAEAYAPALLEVNGLQIAVLAFNDVADPADAPGAGDRDFAACAPGICPAGRAWLDARALDAVSQARQNAELVVVLVHWGREYAGEPSLHQRIRAHQLVEAGADLVLGSHPHVVQPAMLVEAGARSGFVAYSLGNLVFDAPDNPAISSGAVLRVWLDAGGVALVAAAPVHTAGGQPRPLALESTAARAILATLAGAQPAPAPISETPATRALLYAWRWQDGSAYPVPPPETLAPAPAHLEVDLRGNGQPLHAWLDTRGVVELRDGPDASAPLAWRNEDPAWVITRIAAGDPNDDGRSEVVLLVWKPDETGIARSHPFLLGWRGGRYRIIWGGSATSPALQDLAVADLDGDGRNELVTLEGGERPGDPGEHVAVWHWHGWGFQLEWRSPPGHWQALALQDRDGDSRPEIVAVARPVEPAGK